MPATVIRLCLALGLALSLTGCGDTGDGADIQPTAGDGATTQAPASPADQAGDVTVELVDFAIQAPEQVPAGTEITVRNTGDVAHTFTATEGSDFDTGTVQPGGEATVTVTEPGTVSFQCDIHPDRMAGQFEVTG